MSLVDISTIRCEALFLKAFVAWISGDLDTTQLLCSQCLNHLRFNSEFPHLALCLYVFAVCVREGTKVTCTYHITDILKENRNFRSIKIISPWEHLAKFDGSNKSFLVLVRNSSPSYCNGLAQYEPEVKESPCDGQFDQFTVENLEDLASFCLDNDFPELGLNFAIEAHLLSYSLNYPNCNGFVSSVNQSPCIGLRLAKRLGMQRSCDNEVHTGKLDLLHESNINGEIYTSMVESSSPTEKMAELAQRRRTRYSILKSPSLVEAYSSNHISGDCRLKREKRVRFSLSDMHPPPHLEAEYGGRNNDKRYSDLLRRRNSNRKCNYFGLFWPSETCSISKHLIDLLTILLFVSLIIIFTLLFVSLIFCVPLAWLSSPGNLSFSNILPIYTDVCFRLLDCFYLRSLVT